jgi:hypothetical protein
MEVLKLMGRFNVKAAGKAFTLAALLVAVVAGGAFAQATPPTVDWTANATAVKDSLTSVMAAVIPTAVGILALVLGFKWFKKLVKGST